MGSNGGKVVWLALLLAAIANIALLVVLFHRTGGAGLARVVWHYLLRNISDKEYSWQDFRDRGPETFLYGFYSGGDEESFYLWTLSGRKKFGSGQNEVMYDTVCA